MAASGRLGRIARLGGLRGDDWADGHGSSGATSPDDCSTVGCRSSSSGTFMRDPTPSAGRSSRGCGASDSGSVIAHAGTESDALSLEGGGGGSAANDGGDGGGAIALEFGPLLPLELEGDQETWLCSVEEQVDFGEPDVWSDIYWSPPTVDFEFDFGGGEPPAAAAAAAAVAAAVARRSVCSMSVQRGEPEAELDCFAEWIAARGRQDGGQGGHQSAGEEDVQLLFPAGCTPTDMGWLLVTRSQADELEPVDLLFPEGCSEKDMEWLVAPGGSVMADDDGELAFGVAAAPHVP